MILQTNSVGRAIGAAKVFASRPWGCKLIRCRIVNRLFAAEEGEGDSLTGLMKTLDQDVTVRDPARMRPSSSGTSKACAHQRSWSA
jgi:hypothetical protein